MSSRLRNILPSIFFMLFTALATAEAEEVATHTVTITINYGEHRPTRSTATEVTPEMTALEVLQSVADVRVRAAGKFQFVTSIDGLESIRGKMGWFYAVDSVKAKTLASTRRIGDARTMHWYYGVEACY